MGGVLTLDAAFLGSVPADLGKALLERARADCGPVLHRAIESMREPLATMAGYHLGWWNADRSTAAGSSGKYFRAALVYAAAAACGGDVGDATPVSAAVELVHNFTLLHDDVMDGDATRRGRPTVWSVWGVGGAILLGDALHATAVRILTGLTDECVAVRAIRRLQMSCLDLCIGQFEDCLLEGQPEVTVDDYLRMAAGKTAALAEVFVGPVAQGYASGEVTVLLASPRSFCAGVERAIETVKRVLDVAEGPVYVRKQIVHNTVVVAELRDRGAVFVEDLDEIPDPPPPGAVVVFSAHGVSPAVRAGADERGLQVVDATCPLVAKVHAEAARFAARGDTVVFIGHAGHEETEGTLGVAPRSTLLVQTPADVAALNLPEGTQLSYLTQTTLALDETADVIDALRARFPTLGQPPSEDICYATTNRQRALQSMVGECDVVLVIGSCNSSNSRRLVELAQRSGTPAYLIDGPDDIEPEWLSSVSTIGVTAGASAPPRLVGQVIDALRGYASITVVERSIATETVRFGLPKQVRAQ